MSVLRSLVLLIAVAPVALLALDEADLKDDGGQVVVHYAIDKPTNVPPADTTDPTKQLGLFLCFHEHGGKAPDETKSVIDSLKRLKLSEQFVVIGMQDGTPHGYSPKEDHERALKLIAWAKKTFPINPRRVYLFGRGEGAKMAGEFGTEHADLITAVITYSWGFFKLPDNVKDPALEMPDFYIVLGLKDIPTHLKTVRETYVRARTHGYNVIYREAEGLGGPTKHQPTNDDAILWASRLRHKTMAPSAAEVKLLQPYVNSSSIQNMGGENPAFQQLVAVGGLQTAAVLDPFFNVKNESARVSAAIACSQAMFGNEAIKEMEKKLKDSSTSPALKKAVIDALGVNASYRYSAAQEALITYVTDKTAPAADRVAAIDAMGVALKLQIKGYYQDPPMFKALITCLDDDAQEVRVAALKVLSPIQTTDYKPEMGKTERKAALGKWDEWLGTIVAKEDEVAKAVAAASSTAKGKGKGK